MGSDPQYIEFFFADCMAERHLLSGSRLSVSWKWRLRTHQEESEKAHDQTCPAAYMSVPITVAAPRRPFMSDVPRADTHAVENMGTVVDWLTERCDFPC